MYERGEKYRVVKPGRLSGMKHSGGSSFTGVTVPLPVGSVIECMGSQRGFGDGPQSVAVFRGPNGESGINMEFEPGSWGSPAPGYLERVS